MDTVAARCVFVAHHGGQASGCGLGLANRVLSMGRMEGRLDILSGGSSCDRVSGGGTLGQCPAVGPPGQNGLLTRIVLPLLAFGFSAEFQV